MHTNSTDQEKKQVKKEKEDKRKESFDQEYDQARSNTSAENEKIKSKKVTQ